MGAGLLVLHLNCVFVLKSPIKDIGAPNPSRHCPQSFPCRQSWPESAAPASRFRSDPPPSPPPSPSSCSLLSFLSYLTFGSIPSPLSKRNILHPLPWIFYDFSMQCWISLHIWWRGSLSSMFTASIFDGTFSLLLGLSLFGGPSLTALWGYLPPFGFFFFTTGLYMPKSGGVFWGKDF